jgi:hypothetical protein
MQKRIQICVPGKLVTISQWCLEVDSAAVTVG